MNLDDIPAGSLCVVDTNALLYAEQGVSPQAQRLVRRCSSGELKGVLPQAYIYHHFFELACRAQVGALAGGAEIITPKPEVCEARAKQFGRVGVYDSKSRDWVASMALVEKLYPDYKE